MSGLLPGTYTATALPRSFPLFLKSKTPVLGATTKKIDPADEDVELLSRRVGGFLNKYKPVKCTLLCPERIESMVVEGAEKYCYSPEMAIFENLQSNFN